jgi:rhodanese-related sulfurtransferase
VFSFLKRFSTTTPAIDLAELDRRIAEGSVRVLDVREESEFRGGHVPGAVNIPLKRLEQRLDKLKKDKPYAVICASGSRSLQGTNMLLDNGFEGAVSVRGGTSGWIRSGRRIMR